MFGGVLLFHPGWVVSLALAGLASGFGMGPGVSLPLLTAVTLFTFQCPLLRGECYWWWGVNACCAFVDIGCGCEVWVSFRPVSASSLRLLRGV